jgi:hypothetical protein
MRAAEYSAFEHLRQTLFWRDGDMIVPLAAYFDASGTKAEQQVWAIGGWIAELDQWSRFCGRWREMIKSAPFRPEVKPEKRIFHSAELESQVGIYEGWTKTEKQNFQNEAFTIIEDLQLFPISTAVVKADWDALNIRLPRLKQDHQGNYFVHAFHATMKNVQEWLRDQRVEASVNYVFEAGDLGQPEIERALHRAWEDPEDRTFLHMSGWTMTGKHVLPLQAADIWAYESYKHMINRVIGDRTRNVRYPYQRLYHNVHEKYQTYWDRESLTAMIKTYREFEAAQKKDRDRKSGLTD